MILLGQWVLASVVAVHGLSIDGPEGIEFAPASEPDEPTSTDDPQPDAQDRREYEDFTEARARRKREARSLFPTYGPTLVTGAIIPGFSFVGLGGGISRFVIPHIGFGLYLSDVVTFDDIGVYNRFAVGLHVWLLLVPFSPVTPYLRPSFGGEFFSSRLGAYAQWKAATGLIFRLGSRERFHLRFGAEVAGRLPDGRFARSLRCRLTDNPCSLMISPEIGFGFRFGGE